MAKIIGMQFLSEIQRDKIQHLNLSYDIIFEGTAYHIYDKSLKRLAELEIPKVIWFNYTTKLVKLYCPKSSDTYITKLYNILNETNYSCKCRKCKHIRMQDQVRKRWELPGYRDNQVTKQAMVWTRPGYRDNQVTKQKATALLKGYSYYSEQAKKRWDNLDYREKHITRMKENYKDLNYRWNNLVKNAERMRNYTNASELEVINFLKANGLTYLWQVPLLTKEFIGFDCIIDFYIVDLDMYVNFDGTIHKNYSNIINKDLKLARCLAELGLDFHQVDSLSMLRVLLLEKGGDLTNG